MNAKTNVEKEWLRKLNRGKVAEKKEQTAPQRAMVQTEAKKPVPKHSNGFGDVAGMDELKNLVIESFINVLNNKECAKAFGITPPSLLFLITQKLLEDTISSRAPSLSSRDLREYERIRSEFSPKDESCKHQAIGFH